MLALFAILVGGSAILNLPGWMFARSRNQATWWLPFVGTPAILVWMLLVSVGVGPQSLANIVEAMALTALSVVACYTQVLLLNRRFPAFRRTSGSLLIALIGVAVLLRLFMPLIPE